MKLGEITLFQVANIGKIKFASFSLAANGELIKIAGPNETGKSTILDSLKMAFSSAKTLPNDIIRHGEAEGKITIETSGGYTITRRVTKNSVNEQETKLEVKYQGAPVQGGAVTFLKDFSANFMDPEAISNYSDLEITRVMSQFAGINLDAFDKAIDAQKQKSATLRSSIKSLGEKSPPQGTTDKPVDLQAATEAYTKASETYNQAISTFQKADSRIRELSAIITNTAAEIATLEEQLASKKELLEGATKSKADGEAWVAAHPKPTPDAMDSAKAELDAAVAAQANMAEHVAYKAWYEQKQNLEKDLAVAQQAAVDAENGRKQAMETAVFPDETLRIVNGAPMLGEGLWSNGSTSAKLMAATKLCAASIPEGGARILYIHRGESIGQARQKELAEFAKKNGVQIFMEVMSDSPESIPDSITIEDGEVNFVAVDAAPPVVKEKQPELPVAPSAPAKMAVQPALISDAPWNQAPSADGLDIF